MQYRSIMIAIAVLVICACSVSALTISTSKVTTDEGTTSTTSIGEGAVSVQGNSPEDVQNTGDALENEEMMQTLNTEKESTEEIAEEGSESVEAEGEVASNCTGTSGNELIIRFEPESFEDDVGTLDELAMEQAEFEAHSLIQATVLSDLTEMGMPGLQLVQLPDDMSLEEGIAYYESLDNVRFAEPNYHISIYPDDCPEEVNAESTDDVLIETVDENLEGEDLLNEGDDLLNEGEDVRIESGDGFTKTIVESTTPQYRIDSYSF